MSFVSDLFMVLSFFDVSEIVRICLFINEKTFFHRLHCTETNESISLGQSVRGGAAFFSSSYALVLCFV